MTDTVDVTGVPPVLSVLVLAALAILPMNAPLTDLPADSASRSIQPDEFGE